MRSASGFAAGFDVEDVGMALDAELPNAAAFEHLWIGRSVRRMACRATFELERRMFIDEGPLFIGVALYTGLISANRQFGLLLIKTAVRIMAIAAAHRAFEHFVPEWLGELGLHVVVTGKAQLGLAVFQHRPCRQVRALC